VKPSKKKEVRVGVIGCGYWGPNLIRNFHEIQQARVAAISDLRQERLTPYLKKIPGVRLTTRYRDILTDPSIDAVVIATPVSTHYPIASQAIRQGKHVLVEKPLTLTTQEGLALVKLARRRRVTLMVGHTFEYHPAVLKIGELLRTGELGHIHYIDSVRVNLGLYQADGLNVIWDLAPHDIAITSYWAQAIPQKVSAWGHSFVKRKTEDVAFIRLEFPKGIFAYLHVSWLAPTKLRRMTVAGSKKMAIYDDLESVEKIKIADHGVHLDSSDPNLKMNYRIGDIVSPRIPVTEPLHQECFHFIDCILQGRTPVSDGERGLQIVRVLEATDRSMRRGGAAVRV
jgi:predicted dehydrogenase